MRNFLARSIAKADGLKNPKALANPTTSSLMKPYIDELDGWMNGIKRRIFKASKILIGITISLLIVDGDSMSRMPLLWRIGYEWRSLIDLVLYHLK